jgi:hypothetical protein
MRADQVVLERYPFAVTLLTLTSLTSPTIGDLPHRFSSVTALNGLAS